MSQNPRNTGTETPPLDSRPSPLSRRAYIRSLGALAAVGTIATTTASGAEDDYETITLSAGEDRVIEVGSGETFENVLIDCSASNARATITAYGTDWTIRNVAIDGQLDVGKPGAVFGIADTGTGSSTFENVYLGDGATNAGEATAETAMWVSPEHNGHLDIRHVNVQGFSDNGIYASAPGGAGGGSVHIDSCYAANCRVAHYRVGSAESQVTNSSVLLDDNGYDGRGIWAWEPGPVQVENCQLEMNGRHYGIRAGGSKGSTTVSVADTDYDTGFNSGINTANGSSVDLAADVGTDPSAFVPDGVPESATDAAGSK